MTRKKIKKYKLARNIVPTESTVTFKEITEEKP